MGGYCGLDCCSRVMRAIMFLLMRRPAVLMQDLPLSSLMRSENALLVQRLAGLAGLGSAVTVDAGKLLAVDCPTRLVLRFVLGRDGSMEGTARAWGDAWPLADQSVDLVVLRHALDVTEQPRALVAEALRVTASGGHVLVAGVHPCSLWHVWNFRRMRAVEPAYCARFPLQIESWMRGGGMHMQSRLRFGGALPTSNLSDGGGGVMSACYLLHARRSSSAVTPMKLTRPRSAPVAINASLASAAQRQQGG